MRTLFDIVDGAKQGQRPTADESYYAMLVLVALLNMATADMQRLGKKAGPWGDVTATEAHNRYHTALNTDPQAFLGNDVPGNAEYDARIKLGNRLLDRILGQQP